MPGVVTAGETMILGMPSLPGRLRHAMGLELKIGGAESNVAIALSRLGVSAGWVGYLSADEPGRIVLDRIRGEGVDTSCVRRLEDAPTGLYLREKVGPEVRVYYYRRGSAASKMAPGAFDPDYLRGAVFLHLTGITPALSPGCRAFVLWAMQQARSKGLRVSFDVNFRSKLWSAGEAKEFTERVLSLIDLLFLGDQEARALWDCDDAEFMLGELSKGQGPQEVILKRGKEGCLALVEGQLLQYPAFLTVEVDPIGAGDAFDAGYLAGHLWGLTPEERLRTANAMGALSVATLGDYEGLPDRGELRDFLEGRRALGR